MWFLETEDKSIKAKCSVAPTTPLEFVTTFVDQTGANLNQGPLSEHGTITNVSADIIPPPIDKVKRSVESISIINSDNVTQVVTVQYWNADPFPGSGSNLFIATLLPGWKLEFNQYQNWNIYDAEGLKKNAELAIEGDVDVNITTTTKQTYSAAINGLVTAALATDVFEIKGSASKTIKITKLEISGTTTAGSGITIPGTIIKRSTANTGGTSTALTAVPHDSLNAAATATLKAYTANPTLGTLVGGLIAKRITFTQSGAQRPDNIFEFTTRIAQPVVLRGTSESVCVNFGGTTITGPLISIYVEWTEE